jgi:hypothetical protein
VADARQLLAPGPVREWFRGHREPDLPHLQWGPTVASKFVFDEWALQVENARNRMRVPTTDFRRRLRTELAEANAQFAANGWLDDPRRYHESPPVLRDPSVRRRGIGPLSFEHLRFPSAYEPHPDEPGRDRWLGYRRNQTAHAWVLRHRGAPRPWVVCVNGYRTGEPMVDMLTFRAGHLHRRLGLNVAIVVQPLHGPRRIGRPSGDRTVFAGALNLVHTVAQAAWDVRRVLSWVRGAQSAPAVGVHGVSLGGLVVSLTAALDGGLDAVIAGVPEADIVRGMRRNVEPLLPPFYEQWGLSWQPLERVVAVVSPLSLPAPPSPETLFIYAGLADRWVRPSNVKALWAHWGRPAICWYQGSHLSFMAEPDVRRFVDGALRARLGASR